MTKRYNYCPYCNKRIVFKIEMKDIDQSLYPAPVYIFHKDESCNKISTFYVDSEGPLRLRCHYCGYIMEKQDIPKQF